MEFQVRLPKPHPKQAQIRASKAKRKVICSGRRSGKTRIAALVAVEQALQGRRILFAAPTLDQVEFFWEYCKRSLKDPIAGDAIYKNETQRLLEFPNGARIRCKTAWNADTLRGDYADLLFMEEFAMMHPNAWREVGAPMLLDNDGDAWFISTPKRKNHFHAMYTKAIQDTSGRWQAWHFTSHDNPYLSQDALQEITSDMTEDAYRQEIMAEFLESEGSVFRNLPACLLAPLSSPADHAGHRLVMGVDWGKQSDFTAISIVCADCRQEVVLDRFNQLDYAFQRQRLNALWEKWNVAHIECEQNAMGEPILEQLQRDGLPAVGFLTTAQSKPSLIESLALAFEREECQWLPDPVAQMELESYERKVNPTTNRSQYSAPAGVHDDTVIARALAWHATMQNTGSLFLW